MRIANSEGWQFHCFQSKSWKATNESLNGFELLNVWLKLAYKWISDIQPHK